MSTLFAKPSTRDLGQRARDESVVIRTLLSRDYTTRRWRTRRTLASSCTNRATRETVDGENVDGFRTDSIRRSRRRYAASSFDAADGSDIRGHRLQDLPLVKELMTSLFDVRRATKDLEPSSIPTARTVSLCCIKRWRATRTTSRCIFWRRFVWTPRWRGRRTYAVAWLLIKETLNGSIALAIRCERTRSLSSRSDGASLRIPRQQSRLRDGPDAKRREDLSARRHGNVRVADGDRQ